MVDCCGCCKLCDVGPGGNKETYCGPITLVIGVLFFPFICCCPVDVRDIGTDSQATGTKSFADF